MVNGPSTSRVPSGYSYETLERFVGVELGVSDWVTIDQTRIDSFANCTGDHQWIHVDRDRAAAESPFGGTIAHGFLVLSMLAAMQMDLGLVPSDAGGAINAGVSNVRFKTPVLAGSRIRARVRLLSAEAKGSGRKLLVASAAVEVDGQPAPALTGEIAAMIFKGH
jgi:acyl dehydratase